MKKYEKPVVMINEELAEGVYAASGVRGTSDCWDYHIYEVQTWDGSAKVFEVKITHHTGLEHISSATTLGVTFSSPLTEARSEFDCSLSGATVSITRALLADAYKDGDLVTYKIWASAADQATTEALAITGVTLTCDKSVNVQGNGGDE